MPGFYVIMIYNTLTASPNPPLESPPAPSGGSIICGGPPRFHYFTVSPCRLMSSPAISVSASTRRPMVASITFSSAKVTAPQ